MRRDRRRKALWIILLSVLLWTEGGVLCSREIYAAETGADAAEVNTSQGEGGSNEMTEDELISMGIVFSIVLFIVVLFWVITSIDEKNTEKLEQGFAEFDRIMKEFKRKDNIVETLSCIFLEGDIDRGMQNHWGIIEAGELLSEEAQEAFGLRKYLDKAFWNDVVSVRDEVIKEINDLKREMEEYQICRNELASKKGKTKREKIQIIEKYCRLAKKISEDSDDGRAKLHDFVTHGSFVEDAENTGKMVSKILNTEIRCDIRIRAITGQEKRRGKMSCHNADGTYRKGISCLDDITVLGCGKLGEVIGNTGIYVYGYDGEEETKGIALKGIRAFVCALLETEERLGEETESEAEAKPEKSALLCPGKEYRLTCRTDKQEASMIVKISE